MARDIILVVPLWAVIMIPCILGLLIGFWFQHVAHTWHRALIKPIFYPHLLAIICILLASYGLLEYCFILLGAYDTDQNPGEIRNLATLSITLYWIIISFNLIWFFIFFIKKYLFVSFIINIIHLGLSSALITFAFELDSIIGYLVLPLLLWSAFSVYLSIGLWWLNRGGVVIDLDSVNQNNDRRRDALAHNSQNINYDSINESV